MAASPTAGAAEPSVNAAPFADFDIDAGSSVFGLYDLKGYFTATTGDSLEFSAIPLDGPSGPSGAIVELRIDGSMLTVVASDVLRTGTEQFQIEACVVGASPPACSRSNTFEVRVQPSSFGTPVVSGDGREIVPSVGWAQLASGQSVTYALDLPFEHTGDPAWYLDDQFVGEGRSVTVVTPAPGAHEIEARVETLDGPVVIRRGFHVAAPAPAPGVGAWLVPLGLTVAGAVGIAVSARSARLRRPFLLAVIGILYPRLKPESLLDHFTRGALYQLIKEEPGIHFSELRRRADCSHGGAVHHLRVLEQAGYIRAQTAGAYTRFFITGQRLEDTSYGLTPTERAIFSAVVNRPGISQGEISLQLQRSHGTVSRGITRLVSLGFVTTGRSMRKRLVYPRPEAPLAQAADVLASVEVKR